jgi:inorganic phosphate transporter, PiT family
MGVITLALIANGTLAKGSQAPVWVITCCAFAIALGTYIGGTFGVIVDLVVLAALCGLIYWRSRATKVDHSNVNAEWAGTVAPEQVPAAATAA